jgi:hypothetical protein
MSEQGPEVVPPLTTSGLPVGQLAVPAPPTPGSPPAWAVPPAQPAVTYATQSSAQRRVGKVRRPWGVWGLSLITLGIYGLYWWYKANEEVREYDAHIQVQPGIAVIAMVPIASLVTLVKTGGRISQAQRFSGIAARCSGGLGILFAILLGTHVVYYQSQLNKLWAVHGNQLPGTSV